MENINTTRHDTAPKQLSAALNKMTLAEKLFAQAVMQMGLAFEAAKKQEEQKSTPAADAEK